MLTEDIVLDHPDTREVVEVRTAEVTSVIEK
jgi:hypothetical protein